MRPCLLSIVLVSACARPAAPAPACDGAGVITGLYWGSWPDVEQGARVAVWMHGDGHRVRGSWEMPPWRGEIEGTVRDNHDVDVVWREEGVVAAAAPRAALLTFRADRDGTLRAHAGDAGTVTLRPARFMSPALRPGLWLSRWTGLPAGMVVETTLTRTPAGTWRATYRYQGREGSFEGEQTAGGRLRIRWREVSSGDHVARGAGLLAPSPLGLRGSFGVGDSETGTGWWSLEPAEAP
ncbi:MAG: hypothetical protein R3A52_01580 [Polyangiales bacterium]